MSVSDGFAFAKLPLRFLLGGNRIAAAAAGGRTADALEQFANGSHHAPQHSRILTSAMLKVLRGDSDGLMRSLLRPGEPRDRGSRYGLQISRKFRAR
jgi:hypothetical protein